MALAQVGGACRYKEALALYYRALQISESSYGSEHPDVAEHGHRSPDRPLLPHNARATRASSKTKSPRDGMLLLLLELLQFAAPGQRHVTLLP